MPELNVIGSQLLLHDAGEALDRLIVVARRDTHQSRIVADFSQLGGTAIPSATSTLSTSVMSIALLPLICWLCCTGSLGTALPMPTLSAVERT